MFSKKRLKIDDNERVMVVAQDTKTNTKKILWHSNDKVYGDLISNCSQLNIIGLRSEASGTVCRNSVVDENSDWWGTFTSEYPVVITYKPESYYKANTSTSNPDRTMPYNGGVEKLTKTTNRDYDTYYGACFCLVGDKIPYTTADMKPYGSTTGKEIGAIYDASCINANAPLLIDVKKETNGTYTATFPMMKNVNKLPDGNVIALIKVYKPTESTLKNEDNYWHFHIGPGIGVAINTYVKSSWCKQTTCGQMAIPTLDTYKNYNQGVIDKTKTSVDYAAAKDFIPLNDEWYELFIDTSQDVLADYYAYRNVTTSSRWPYWRFLGIRKASEEHKRMWLNDESVQTEANVNYYTDKIDYEFWIDAPNFKESDKVIMSWPKANSLGTNIKTIDAKYNTSKKPTENQISNDYVFLPKEDVVIDFEVGKNKQTIFNMFNPINIVYYSGCKFMVDDSNVKMNPYYNKSSIDLVARANASYRAEPVSDQGYKKGAYCGVNVPILNYRIREYREISVKTLSQFNSYTPKPTDIIDPYYKNYTDAANNNIAGYNVYSIPDDYTDDNRNTTYKSQAWGCFVVQAQDDGRIYTAAANSWTSNKTVSANGNSNATFQWSAGPSGSCGQVYGNAYPQKLGGPTGDTLAYIKFDSRGFYDIPLSSSATSNKNVNSWIWHWHVMCAPNGLIWGPDPTPTGGNNSSYTNGAYVLTLPMDSLPQTSTTETYKTTISSTSYEIPYNKIYTRDLNADGSYKTKTQTLTVLIDDKFNSQSKEVTGGSYTWIGKYEKIKKDKWYSLVWVPATDKWNVNNKLNCGYPILVEVPDKEIVEYLSSCTSLRYAKKLNGEYIFTITVNSSKIQWSINESKILDYFEYDTSGFFKIKDKNKLLNDFSKTSGNPCVYYPSNSVCIDIDKNLQASLRDVYNSSNPICIPEMSGLTFVNI